VNNPDDRRRRLAAILSADVAGYSRLMGQDEDATITALNECRAIFRDRIEFHRGRVVDTAGDSVLSVFDSIVEAVACAHEVQSELGARSEDLPADSRMLFRIGINLGDVVEQDDGTIYGDGVNVAARLEGLAEPGGICVSESAHMQVEGKTNLGFQGIGEHEVKNIARPVRAFQVIAEKKAPISAQALALPDKPSIAVLPFTNMSGDPEQAYFSDGLTEDIITDLSKMAGLFVIARNSTFAYRDSAATVQEVSRQLGVRHVLEGSVRKVGNRVRITAQLIDGQTGRHVWAERYDRDLANIFEVQDEVTRRIVAAFATKMTVAEPADLIHRRPRNPEAYDYFLRGREAVRSHRRSPVLEGRSLLESAIELEPTYSGAYAMLSLSWLSDYINGWGDSPDRSLARAKGLAEKAVTLDGSEPSAALQLARIFLWMKQHDRALTEAQRALALDPNYAMAHGQLGMMFHYTGQSERAIAPIETALRLDPYSDIYLHWLGQSYFGLGRYDEAIASLKRRLIRSPDTYVSRVLLAASYGHLGRTDKARAAWAEVFRVNPEYSLEHRRRVLPYQDPTDFDRVVEGLRHAGIDTSSVPARN
jgi:adenylate cyclase